MFLLNVNINYSWKDIMQYKIIFIISFELSKIKNRYANISQKIKL